MSERQGSRAMLAASAVLILLFRAGGVSPGAEEKKYGQILAVEQNGATIDLGTKDYVSFGMEFKVYRRAETLTAPLTDEVILIGERLVGSIKVTKSGETSSACGIVSVEPAESLKAGDKAVSVPGTGNLEEILQRELDAKVLEMLYQGKTAARKSKDDAVGFYRQVMDDKDLSRSQYAAAAAEEIKRYDAVSQKVAYKSALGFPLSGKRAAKSEAKDVAVDGDGNIWVLDNKNYSVSKYLQRGDFVLGYGGRGTEAKDLSQPVSITVDASNNLYILDEGKPKVVKVDSKGRFAGVYGPKDGFTGSANGVSDVAVNSKEDVFMVNRKAKQVYSYNKSNMLWAVFGQEGQADGEFLDPVAIAVDAEDRIYVVDAFKKNVQVFSADLRFLRKFAPKGISDPIDMAVYHSELLYILSGTSGVVTKVDAEKGETVINFGGVGGTHGKFTNPSGICVDDEGNIYVADGRSSGIQEFTPEGRFTGKLGDDGLEEPCAISVDGRDNIYILDKRKSSFQKFDIYGWSHAITGSPGEGPGQFVSAERICTGFDNKVYVLDTRTRKVHQFDEKGKTLFAFGDEKLIPKPVDICADVNGNIYVLDSGNCTVVKFDGTGKLINSFGSKARGRGGSKEGEFRTPERIGVDPEGNVFVLDVGNYEVYKFSTQTGMLQKTFGGKGRNKGEFSRPAGMAVDGLGYVYVADTGNRVVQKFDNNGVFISEVGSYGDGVGQYKEIAGLAVDGAGTVYVLDTGLSRIQQFKQ